MKKTFNNSIEWIKVAIILIKKTILMVSVFHFYLLL